MQNLLSDGPVEFGFEIPEVDMICVADAARAAGTVINIEPSSFLPYVTTTAVSITNTPNPYISATVPTGSTGTGHIMGVMLTESKAAGDLVQVRIQGRCNASVLSTAGGTFKPGRQLAATNTRTLQADFGAVTGRRMVAMISGSESVVLSAGVAKVVPVIMVGAYGFGTRGST